MTREHVGAVAAAALCVGAMLAAGCATITTTDGTRLNRGMPDRKLTDKIGPPDAVAQTLEGRTRYYLPDEPPAEAWEGKSLATDYYYLDRGYKITAIDGRVRETRSITREEWDQIAPLVRAKRSAEPRDR